VGQDNIDGATLTQNKATCLYNTLLCGADAPTLEHRSARVWSDRCAVGRRNWFMLSASTSSMALKRVPLGRKKLSSVSASDGLLIAKSSML
jgi:hypothetical protein